MRAPAFGLTADGHTRVMVISRVSQNSESIFGSAGRLHDLVQRRSTRQRKPFDVHVRAAAQHKRWDKGKGKSCITLSFRLSARENAFHIKRVRGSMDGHGRADTSKRWIMGEQEMHRLFLPTFPHAKTKCVATELSAHSLANQSRRHRRHVQATPE